jgi:hypothetical protein
MAFSLAPLLLHSEAVPLLAREALRAANVAHPEEREEKLEEAARILWRETDLECRDARELVGLPQGTC